MINTTKPHTPTHTFHPNSLRRNINRAIARLFIVCCMLGPTSLFAKSLYSLEEVTFSSDIALQEWPDPMMQYPDLERLDHQHMETLADEASKQAQTDYLAKKFRLSPKVVRKYVDLAWAEAENREGIEPELLIAIMQKESSLRARVQNRYGAQGLMQVVRRWHREKLSASESLLDPAVNVRVGADILEEYLEWAGGNLAKALKKYSGNARGYTNKILSESRKLAELGSQNFVLG